MHNPVRLREGKRLCSGPRIVSVSRHLDIEEYRTLFTLLVIMLHPSFILKIYPITLAQESVESVCVCGMSEVYRVYVFLRDRPSAAQVYI